MYRRTLIRQASETRRFLSTALKPNFFSRSLKKDDNSNEDVNPELDELYKALSTPVEIPKDRRLPTKLGPDYLNKLSLTFESHSLSQTELEDRNSKTLGQLFKNSPSVAQISHVVHLNALSGRPEEAQTAFDLIQSTGLQPDLIAYNHLMDAYSRSKNLEKVEEVFQSIQTAGLVPDVVTYSTLIKTHVQALQLKQAFTVYESMKAQNLVRNRIIFTTLIKGCVDAKDAYRAWKVFDHMRSEVCEPDSVAYNAMINVCALEEKAERALDLFEEMAQKKLPADELTFTALIKACGSREDFYQEAFTIFDQTVSQGFTPNTNMYNVLLSITAKQGDIERARILWNDMIDRRIHDANIMPDSYTFSMMFKSYASAVSRLRRKPAAPGAVLQSEALDVKAPALDSQAGGSEPTLARAGNASSADSLEQEKGLTTMDVSDLKLDPNQMRVGSLLKEAEQLWSFLNPNTTDSPSLSTGIELNVHVLNAYFKVLCSHPTFLGITEKALAFFNTEYTKNGIEIPGYAYQGLLKSLTANKRLFMEHGPSHWAKYLEWDAGLEARFKDSVAPLSEPEKERLRCSQERGRDVIFQGFLSMVRGYTRVGEYEKAVATVEEIHKFRHVEYMPAVFFRDIWSLVQVARDEAEDGKWDKAQKLMALCAQRESDPMLELQKHLKAKNIPRNWWGWKVLNISDDDLKRTQKKNKKIRTQVMQRKQAHTR